MNLPFAIGDAIPERDRETWDVRRFSQSGNLPVDVGTLAAADAFRRQAGIRVLDLALHLPDQGWAIPSELSQFTEAIAIATAYELRHAPLSHVYITVDQKPVGAGRAQRREGWHSDAYVVDDAGRQLDVIAENAPFLQGGSEPIERTYVVYDSLPTLFLDGPFPLECDANDCDAVLRSFNDVAEGQTPITYPPFTVLALTPYCVHSVQVNNRGTTLLRTFVKIQFSRHRYNRTGNTLNPRFDYDDWTWVVRDPKKREHRHAELLGRDD